MSLQPVALPASSPDVWMGWLAEVETMFGARITDGDWIDMLYDAFMADTPAEVAAFGLLLARRPSPGLQHVSQPLERVMERVERSYADRVRWQDFAGLACVGVLGLLGLVLIVAVVAPI